MPVAAESPSPWIPLWFSWGLSRSCAVNQCQGRPAEFQWTLSTSINCDNPPPPPPRQSASQVALGKVRHLSLEPLRRQNYFQVQALQVLPFSGIGRTWDKERHPCGSRCQMCALCIQLWDPVSAFRSRCSCVPIPWLDICFPLMGSYICSQFINHSWC